MYGIFINELPIMISNPILGFENLLILIAKFIYDKDNISNKKTDKEEKIEKKKDINIFI